MGILSNLARKKIEPVRIQVALPPDVHKEASKALKVRNISWQDALLAFVESLVAEAKAEKKAK